MKLFRKCYIHRLIRNSIFNFIPEREREKNLLPNPPPFALKNQRATRFQIFLPFPPSLHLLRLEERKKKCPRESIFTPLSPLDGACTAAPLSSGHKSWDRSVPDACTRAQAHHVQAQKWDNIGK